MNWWTVIATFVATIGGPAVVLKIAGDRLLERQKAHYSKEMAEVAHERSILFAERQNVFSMGANSHMATVVFDKHIGFCEEYVQAVSNALYTSIRDKTGDLALDVEEFFKIRQKWVLWLSQEIEVKLDRFERGVAVAQVVDANGAPRSIEGGIRTIISELREVLGTEELTALRNELLVRSLRNPPKAS
jgi:hypothetical protein